MFSSRLQVLAVLALGIGLFGCLPGVRQDPGDLEVRNYLRDPILAVVGGAAHNVPGCSTIALAGVELRGVRILTPTGLDLMPVDSPRGVPIGPRRFILVTAPMVQDLRTSPNRPRPVPAMECQEGLGHMVRPRGPVGG